MEPHLMFLAGFMACAVLSALYIRQVSDYYKYELEGLKKHLEKDRGVQGEKEKLNKAPEPISKRLKALRPGASFDIN